MSWKFLASWNNCEINVSHVKIGVVIESILVWVNLNTSIAFNCQIFSLQSYHRNKNFEIGLLFYATES